MEKASNTAEAILKKEQKRVCLICMRPDEFNVCFRRDGIVSARKVFKRYFIYNEGLYKKYRAMIYAKKGLKEPEKEGELAKIMNSQYVINKLNEQEKRFKEDIVNIGMLGLKDSERQIFFTAYSGEYKRMKDNYEYGCRKIGYDPAKGKFFINDIDFIEQLRYENRLKDKQF